MIFSNESSSLAQIDENLPFDPTEEKPEMEIKTGQEGIKKKKTAEINIPDLPDLGELPKEEEETPEIEIAMQPEIAIQPEISTDSLVTKAIPKASISESSESKETDSQENPEKYAFRRKGFS